MIKRTRVNVVRMALVGLAAMMTLPLVSSGQGDRSKQAGDQPDVLTLADATLVFFRDNPQILTSDRVIAAATEQIYAEQKTWQAISAAVSPPAQGMERPRRGGISLRHPNPKRPAFTYEWQSYWEQNQDLAKKELINVFLRANADWSFVTRDPQWDDGYDALVVTFIFKREKVENRDAQFAAHELAEVYKNHLLMAAAAEPSTFQFDVPLSPPTYDFKAGTFQFPPRESGGLLRAIEGASFEPPSPNSRGRAFVVPASLQAAALYSANGYESSFKLAKPDEVRPGVAMGGSPTSVWRDQMGGANRLPGVYTLAFDRQLIASSVPVESGRAETLLRAAQTTRGGVNWTARVVIDDAHGLVATNHDERRQVTESGILVARISKLDIYGPGNQLIASINPSSLPAPVPPNAPVAITTPATSTPSGAGRGGRGGNSTPSESSAARTPAATNPPPAANAPIPPDPRRPGNSRPGQVAHPAPTTPPQSVPPSVAPPQAQATSGMGGCWTYNTVPLHMEADGRVTGFRVPGRWKAEGGNRYSVTWDSMFETVHLSADGRTLSGINNIGGPFSATRAPGTPATSDFAGTWVWGNGATVEISGNGSAKAAGIVSGRWTKSGTGYRVDWDLILVDQISLSGDGNRLTGTSTVGTPVAGVRTPCSN